MALSRFLLAKPVLHCHTRGIPNSTRWLSSSSNGGNQELSRVKGVEGAKEREHMEMHLKVSPKVTEVDMEVDGSWYSLKSVFTNLKDRMFRNPQIHKQFGSETTASEVIATQTGSSEHIVESGGSNDVLKSSEIRTYSNSTEESVSTCTTSHLQGRHLSEDAVNTTASAVMETHGSPDNIKHKEHDSSVQEHSTVDSAASKVIATQTGGSERIAESGGFNNVLKSSKIPTDSNSTEENISTCTASHLQGRHLSGNAVNKTTSAVMELHGSPNNIKHNEHDSTVQEARAIISDNPEEVMLENGRHLSEDAVNTTASVTEMHGSPDNIKHNEHDSSVQETRATILDNPEEVMLDNGKWLLEEAAFGTIVKPNNYQKNEAGHLISYAHHLFDDAFDVRQNISANESASIRNKKCKLEKKTGVLVDRPPSSDSSQLDDGLVDLFKTSASEKNAAETGSVDGDLLTPSESFSNHDGISLKKVERPFDGLIGHIKKLQGVPAQFNVRCATHNTQSQDELQKSDPESRKVVSKVCAVSKNSKKKSKIKKEQSAKIMTKDEGGNLLTVEKDDIKLQKSARVLQTSKKDSSKTPLKCLAGHTENRVWLRFLHNDTVDSDIVSSFRHCGPISKIKKDSSFEGSHFFDALVHFKTREGLKTALKKPEVLVRNSIAFVEETSLEDTANKISIPNLIDDIDIPVALVKHPTRTVKIKQLTDDVSSHQLKEALSFCGSGINGFFLETSGSNAYVEFKILGPFYLSKWFIPNSGTLTTLVAVESEDAKDRALAKHVVQVSGKQLLIFRVDAPRTTVVRILNYNPLCKGNVTSVCKSFGKLIKIKQRHDSIMDVYFKVEEWPNMLNILNSLNGLEVDGSQWVAQPAPVFPPLILRALWNHPVERRRLIALMQNILEKLEHPTDTAKLKNMAARFYGCSL